jgi:hypothetical protein
VVSVLVVSVLVAVPIGVSTRLVDSDFEVSVEDDEVEGAGAEGWTIVVELDGAACFSITVSFCTVGSFTTVVDEVEAGRSHAERAAAATMRAGMANFIAMSPVSMDMPL